MPIPDFPISDPEGHFAPFYEGLANGELRLSAVAGSDEWNWYPQDVIPGRPDASIEWKKVSPVGQAYSFTTVERCLLPGDHSAETPYTVVLFESDEAPGCRVPGVLVDAEGAEPACGMRLRLSPVRVADRWIAGFAPVDSNADR